MAETMMERFNNMFRDDPAPTEGVGRMIDNEEDMKVALGDAMAMGGDILENFLQSELPDLLAIAEKDPNFGNVLANAIKDYPSVLGMMAPKPDMDEVRGTMGPVIDAMEAAGAGASLPAPVGRMSDMDVQEKLRTMEEISKAAEESPVQGFQESLIDPGYGMAAPMMAPKFGPQFRPGENNGPFDRDLAAGTEGGYGMEPMPMEYASGGYVNKPMEYASGGYVNKPRAMGQGGYVQGQGSNMGMAEKENIRPVNRTLSTALSPTLSVKLFG
tara:strand:- start:1057 stop:1869 length:813 start_codon:yes stop_codon:yes gene_type:complete